MLAQGVEDGPFARSFASSTAISRSAVLKLLQEPCDIGNWRGPKFANSCHHISQILHASCMAFELSTAESFAADTQAQAFQAPAPIPASTTMPKEPSKYEAADGAKNDCSTSSPNDAYGCLCRGGGAFVIVAAPCVEKNSPGDLNPTYEALVQTCTMSSAQHLPYTIAQWRALVGAPTMTVGGSGSSNARPGGQTTSGAVSMPDPSETLTAHPTSNSATNAGNGGGMSTEGRLAAIAAPISCVVAIIGMAIACLLGGGHANTEDADARKTSKRSELDDRPNKKDELFGISSGIWPGFLRTDIASQGW